jgi:hypothetical protein
MTGGCWGNESLAEVVGTAGADVELSSVMFAGLDRGEGVFARLFVSTARGGTLTSLISCLVTGMRLRGAD